MFNIGAAELIVILLIAFLVVGPKDLPKVGRALGKAVRRARTMLDEVKRETGIDEMEAEFKSMEKTTRDAVKAMDIRPDLAQAQRDLNGEINTLDKEIGLSNPKAKTGGK